MHSFSACIEKIGINPYVFVPDEVLSDLFAKAKKDRGPIPVHGSVNGAPFTQTLVRYAGDWRLYINTKMLKDSPNRTGETIEIEIDFDPRDRSLPIHPKLRQALDLDSTAHSVFQSLTPSHQSEINRYISGLKTEEKVAHNVQRAIDFLHGKGKFVGRSLGQ